MQQLQNPLNMEAEIGGLIASQLLVEVGSPDDDLLASGILDSLTLVQLLVSLEEHFEIRIPLEKIEIDDMRSIQSIARLVESQRLAAVAGQKG